MSESESSGTGLRYITPSGQWGVFDCGHSVHVVPLAELHLHTMLEIGACMCGTDVFEVEKSDIPGYAHNGIEDAYD